MITFEDLPPFILPVLLENWMLRTSPILSKFRCTKKVAGYVQMFVEWTVIFECMTCSMMQSGIRR